MKFPNLKSPRAWFHGLVAAFVSGGATVFTTDQGLSLARRVGMNVQDLDWKTFGVLFLTSGFSGAMLYLKKSPLPQIEKDRDEKDENDPQA